MHHNDPFSIEDENKNEMRITTITMVMSKTILFRQIIV